jgi:galactokinase
MNEIDALVSAFANEYGGPPQWVVRAPGHVNLIREYTDINEGFVLPMAIERDVMIAAARRCSPVIRICSSVESQPAIIDLSAPLHPEPRGSWSNYPRGVVAEFLARNISLPGLDVFVQSNLPPGIGLSSSARSTGMRACPAASWTPSSPSLGARTI